MVFTLYGLIKDIVLLFLVLAFTVPTPINFECFSLKNSLGLLVLWPSLKDSSENAVYVQTPSSLFSMKPTIRFSISTFFVIGIILKFLPCSKDVELPAEDLLNSGISF